MLRNRYVFMDGANDGEGGAGGGADGDNILDGGADGDGGNVIEFGADGYKYAGKYDTPQELEKGYSESVKMHTEKMAAANEKMKSFVGAPDEGYAMADDAPQYSEPVMNALQEWGKENSLSQDGFDSLLKMVSDGDAANLETFKAEQLTKLGDNAETRIQNANDKWAAMFGNDSKELMNNMAQTAEGVEFFEGVLAKLSDPTVNPDGGGDVAGQMISDAELDAAMFKKDSAGMLKMQTDPQYKKMVDDMTTKYNSQRGM